MQELEAIQEQSIKDGYTEAANSLGQGLKDALTLHRLGVHAELRSYLVLDRKRFWSWDNTLNLGIWG